jgi:hypothetical protein
MRGGGGAMWRERGSNFYVPLTCWVRVSYPRFSLCPTRPERPLCSDDELGAGHRIRPCRLERAFGPAAWNEILSGALQIPLGDTVGDAL